MRALFELWGSREAKTDRGGGQAGRLGGQAAATHWVVATVHVSGQGPALSRLVAPVLFPKVSGARLRREGVRGDRSGREPRFGGGEGLICSSHQSGC